MICVAIYVVLQITLVLRTLDDLWPLGDILFGTGFYVAGLVLMFGFSAQVCQAVKHYIDGTFFGVLCMLLAVMMVYKCELMTRKEKGWPGLSIQVLGFKIVNSSSLNEKGKKFVSLESSMTDGLFNSFPPPSPLPFNPLCLFQTGTPSQSKIWNSVWDPSKQFGKSKIHY